MNASFVSIKQIAGWKSYTYHLAFASQINSTTQPKANEIWQQWWSPMWNSAMPSGFSNFICQNTFDAAGNSSAQNQIWNTETSIAPTTAGKNAAATFSG